MFLLFFRNIHIQLEHNYIYEQIYSPPDLHNTVQKNYVYR